MKRLYISLTERVARPQDSPEDQGEVVVVDWDSKKTVRTIRADTFEKVPEGRSRGCSGIAFLNDRLYIACREGVSAFDPTGDGTEVERVEFGKPTNLRKGWGFHQMKAHAGALYLCCTGSNAFKVIRNGQVVKTEVVSNGEHEHFNSIGWDSQGNQYHLYMNGPNMVNYTTGKVVGTGLGQLPHDLTFIDDDRILYTASGAGELRLLSVSKKAHHCVWGKPTTKGVSYRSSGFMRGVAYDKNSGSVFVGTAPGTIHEVSVGDWKLKAEHAFGPFHDRKGNASCIYDIVLDPGDWGLNV